MFARLATLVLSLVVGITPIAPEVCDLICASSMPAHQMAQAAHDECGPQISQLPACCAHTARTALPPASVAKVGINPAAMIADSISVQVVDAISIELPPRATTPRPPIPLALRTPLRV